MGSKYKYLSYFHYVFVTQKKSMYFNYNKNTHLLGKTALATRQFYFMPTPAIQPHEIWVDMNPIATPNNITANKAQQNVPGINIKTFFPGIGFPLWR